MLTPSELLDALAACLCAELTPDGADGPDLCFCGVMPGEVVVADIGYGCGDAGPCGMAWVRLESAYPAVSVGDLQVDETASCGTYLGVDVELGVLRCLPAGDRGEPPAAEVLEEVAHQQVDDMVAMRRAVACCDALDDLPHLLALYAPTGPGGLVVGGIWTVSVLL